VEWSSAAQRTIEKKGRGINPRTRQRRKGGKEEKNQSNQSNQVTMPLLSLDSRARVRVVTTAMMFACLRIIEQQGFINRQHRYRQDLVSSSSRRRMVRMSLIVHHHQRKIRY